MSLQWLRLSSADRVLVVVAHPDDEIIGCFGLMAVASRRNLPVRLCIVNHGHQGRLPTSVRLAKSMGIDVLTGPDSAFEKVPSANRELVSHIDGWLTAFSPTVLVSHGCYDGDHQDHRVVGQLASLCWQRYLHRSGRACRLLRVPPMPSGLGFEPTHVVDISDQIDAKCDALNVAAADGIRWYLSANLHRRLAARLSQMARGPDSGSCEAYAEELRLGLLTMLGINDQK
jgi:LmbE family N-acetylglucosaminyl deacetylase